MAKINKYISAVVLAGLGLAGVTHAQIINWGTNDLDGTVMNGAADFVTMFNDPLVLIIEVLCAVIGIGAVIGYLKR